MAPSQTIMIAAIILLVLLTGGLVTAILLQHKRNRRLDRELDIRRRTAAENRDVVMRARRIVAGNREEPIRHRQLPAPNAAPVSFQRMETERTIGELALLLLVGIGVTKRSDLSIILGADAYGHAAAGLEEARIAQRGGDEVVIIDPSWLTTPGEHGVPDERTIRSMLIPFDGPLAKYSDAIRS